MWLAKNTNPTEDDTFVGTLYTTAAAAVNNVILDLAVEGNIHPSELYNAALEWIEEVA